MQIDVESLEPRLSPPHESVSWALNKRLLFALKMASWPKLLVPALLGLAIVRLENEWRFPRLAEGLARAAAYTFCLIVGIVCLNDVADEKVDRTKRAMFPASSKKTIADQILSRNALRTLGSSAFFGAAVAAIYHARFAVSVLGLLGIGVFLSYSFWPVRLNYRGGGEVLETLGTSVVLPLFVADCIGPIFANGIEDSTYFVLFIYALGSLASAIASGLSDEESDRVCGKRTVVVLLGNSRARQLAEACLVLQTTAFAALAIRCVWGPLHEPQGFVSRPSFLALSSLVACTLCALHTSRVLVTSPLATTSEFDAQRLYKLHLHRALWQSTAVFVFLFLGLSSLYLGRSVFYGALP